MKNKAITLAKNIGAIVFWIAVWYVIALWVGIEFIIPTPLSVLRELIKMAATVDFWLSASTSLLSVAVGMIVSLAVGCLIAYLMHTSRIANALLSPVLSVIKATPVASFIVIVFLWLNTSVIPAFIATLIVIPIITSNILQGIDSVEHDLKEVTKIYRFSPLKKLFKLYIPSVYPYFVAAYRSSLGMAWKASVAAELIVATKNSIGEALYNGKAYLDSESVFAWTIVVIIMSIIFEKLTMYLINKLGIAFKFIPKGERNAENQ